MIQKAQRTLSSGLRFGQEYLKCLCPFKIEQGKSRNWRCPISNIYALWQNRMVCSSLNGKTLSTYRRFIRHTWPLRNVVNISVVCDQCKYLLCKHRVNYLSVKACLKSPFPKVQILQLKTPEILKANDCIKTDIFVENILCLHIHNQWLNTSAWLW